jgi:hypothetical protein
LFGVFDHFLTNSVRKLCLATHLCFLKMRVIFSDRAL